MDGKVIFYINERELSKTWHIRESCDQKVNSKQNSQENLFQDYLKQAHGVAGLVECQYGREEKG